MFEFTFRWAAVDNGARQHVTMVPDWAVAGPGVAAPSTAGFVSLARVRRLATRKQWTRAGHLADGALSGV